MLSLFTRHAHRDHDVRRHHRAPTASEDVATRARELANPSGLRIGM